MERACGFKTRCLGSCWRTGRAKPKRAVLVPLFISRRSFSWKQSKTLCLADGTAHNTRRQRHSCLHVCRITNHNGNKSHQGLMESLMESNPRCFSTIPRGSKLISGNAIMEAWLVRALLINFERGCRNESCTLLDIDRCGQVWTTAGLKPLMSSLSF